MRVASWMLCVSAALSNQTPATPQRCKLNHSSRPVPDHTAGGLLALQNAPLRSNTRHCGLCQDHRYAKRNENLVLFTFRPAGISKAKPLRARLVSLVPVVYHSK
jgi:hypothetical protein